MRRKVSGGEFSANLYRSPMMLQVAVKGLASISSEAAAAAMLPLLSVSDVWIIWDEHGVEVGCMYFTPFEGDMVSIHGGFWDKKLAGKQEIMQALCDTRDESLIFSPLRRDRTGKLWAWWLKKCLGFEEVPAYDWLEQVESGTFVMEKRKEKCPQQQ